MDFILPEVTLLAKGGGSPVGGPGPTEILFFLGVLGAVLLVWSLISAALFRGAVALHDRFAREEHHSPPVSFLKAMLVGFLHAGAMMVVQFMANMVMGLMLFAVLSSSGGGPGGPAGMDFGPWLGFGALIVGHALGGWLVKSLLATGFIPCRFGTGALIGLIWLGLEGVLYVSVLGVIAMVMYFSGGRVW
jgi:hypothetical protein